MNAGRERTFIMRGRLLVATTTEYHPELSYEIEQELKELLADYEVRVLPESVVPLFVHLGEEGESIPPIRNAAGEAEPALRTIMVAEVLANGEVIDDVTLIELSAALDESTPLAITPNVPVYAATLATPSPYEPQGDGGPGGAPVPYVPPCDALGSILVNQIPYRFSVPAGLEPVDASGKGRQGEGAVVVILDTAPAPVDCAAALKKLGDEHPLLHSLLSNVRFTAGVLGQKDWQVDIEPADASRLDIVLARMENSAVPMPAVGTTVNSAGYQGFVTGIINEKNKRAQEPNWEHPINDHGLFIAGIVRSLAPKAKIYIVEMLNEKGIGFLDTWIVAVNVANHLAARHAETPVIINNSFYFADAPDLGLATGTQIIDPNTLITQLGSAVLSSVDYWMVLTAAAGNDADQVNASVNPQQPRDARYPAAFDNLVYGIGAVNHDNTTRTLYSNFSDSQASFSVFGGDAIQPATKGVLTKALVLQNKNKPYLETDPNYGLLGVYISPFLIGGYELTPPSPQYKANTTGWARWMGTSFSTAVMSGLLALWAGGRPIEDFQVITGGTQNNPKHKVDFYEKIVKAGSFVDFAPGVVQAPVAAVAERVIPVTQDLNQNGVQVTPYVPAQSAGAP